MRSADIERIELMKALSASRLETYRLVKLPSAAPYLFAGLDMGIVYALLGTIVANSSARRGRHRASSSPRRKRSPTLPAY